MTEHIHMMHDQALFWQTVFMCAFVVLGAFASLLLNLNEAVVVNDFSFAKFVKQNALPTITNIVVGIAIVLCTYDDDSVIHMTKLMAFILGAVSQQFFKKCCNVLLKDKITFVGRNHSNHNTDEDIDDIDA